MPNVVLEQQEKYFFNDVIAWPDANECNIISTQIQEKISFPNHIGILDGTVLPLAFKPMLFGEEYWCHKGGHAVHCLVHCDDVTRILDYLARQLGYMWSTSDQCK